jgi:hypothetical protein
MFDPDTSLVSRLLEAASSNCSADPAADRGLDAGSGTDGASKVRKAIRRHRGHRGRRDFAALRSSSKRGTPASAPLPTQDIEVMRRAMKAFRKSLKVTRLDDESKIGRNPMTDGGGFVDPGHHRAAAFLARRVERARAPRRIARRPAGCYELAKGMTRRVRADRSGVS